MRVTLGRKEYEQLKNFQEVQKQNVYLDAIPNVGIALVGTGVFLGGMAALSFVGLTVEKILTGTKNTIDKASDWLTNYFLENQAEGSPVGPVRIRAIGDRIKEIHDRLQEIQDLINAAVARGETLESFWPLVQEGKRLSNEEAELRAELDSYTTGETPFDERYRG